MLQITIQGETDECDGFIHPLRARFRWIAAPALGEARAAALEEALWEVAEFAETRDVVERLRPA
jgi:hypothetical protein